MWNSLRNSKSILLRNIHVASTGWGLGEVFKFLRSVCGAGKVVLGPGGCWGLCIPRLGLQQAPELPVASWNVVYLLCSFRGYPRPPETWLEYQFPHVLTRKKKWAFPFLPNCVSYKPNWWCTKQSLWCWLATISHKNIRETSRSSCMSENCGAPHGLGGCLGPCGPARVEVRAAGEEIGQSRVCAYVCASPFIWELRY